MIDRTATARVQRLIRWLEPFQRCFGHRAQRLALRTYVHGVFSDSDRKSMQAMLARVTDPITYQGFQHFITHAVWDADRIWRRLLRGAARTPRCVNQVPVRSRLIPECFRALW